MVGSQQPIMLYRSIEMLRLWLWQSCDSTLKFWIGFPWSTATTFKNVRQMSIDWTRDKSFTMKMKMSCILVIQHAFYVRRDSLVERSRTSYADLAGGAHWKCRKFRDVLLWSDFFGIENNSHIKKTIKQIFHKGILLIS